MALPFEYNLDPPESNRKYIECEKCGYMMYYADGNHESDECYLYEKKYLCEDCFVNEVKQDYLHTLEE